MEPLQPGLYESLLTEQLRLAIAGMADRAKLDTLDKAEAPALLAQFLQLKIQQTLENEDGDNHLEKRLQIANGILEALQRLSPDTAGDKITDLSKTLVGVLGIGQNILPAAPLSPLVLSSLFTGSAQRPQLSNELMAEMQSADQVDILISFIKNSGLRLLRRGFDDLRDRNIKVRIITTTYMGASDAEAIEELAKYPNVEIKVSFDTEHTRLHAKAYYFKRLSGFTTAYVGSSNMSNPAMSEGLEWNLKATQKDLPQIIKAFEAEFDAYWNSDNFQPYTAGTDAPRLRASLAKARGVEPETGLGIVLFDIYPRPFQERILDALRAERENRGNFRNLIVAATGTGKTVISAFDYKRFSDKLGRPAKLLFLAHREEIITKSWRTFQQVMKDGNFGCVMGGGAAEPEKMDFLFCTVQTANSRRLWERLGKDFYDFIIVDEAHHSSAETYRDLIMGFSPKVLLGMTATPERMDGDSILPYFGGKITTELRLPEALEEKLLCPFQYFCVADPISLSDESFWDNGKYSVAALERAYAENATTANQRLDTILGALDRYTMGALSSIKGLGFCASVKHAEFMAQAFTSKGLPSLALSATTDKVTRSSAIQRLQQGEIKFIFTVDLFNEGVDIPSVNLVLFLRPTDSLTVYLQQLGRGLRHAKGKECLLVLDFVAQMHKRYRIDRKFAALLPGRRYNIQKEVEASFPHVPPGCSIQLEKQAMELVLANIKAAYANIRTYVVETMRTYEQDTGKSLTFTNYVESYDIEPHRILDVMPWYQWKAVAKGEPVVEEPDGKALQLAAERVGQASGPDYLRAIRRLPEAGIELSERDPAYAHMLHSLLWQKPGHKIGAETPEQAFGRLRANPRSLADLVEVAEYRLGITNARPGAVYPGLPLELYGHYGNDEIQAAFGRDLFKESAQRGVGVLHFPWCKSYALLITLQKSEKDFSPTTMYKDRLMSPNLLHWESQSNTRQASETGQNLIHQVERGYGIYIFVRDQKRIGTTTLPFQFLGRATHVSHEKEKPIEFVWKLDHAIPGELLEGKVG
jgi:superfamily II DNA or RNA helicase/HKD family nuclease